MGNLSLPTLAEGPEQVADLRAQAATASPPGLDLLVVSFGDRAAADYADYACRQQNHCRTHLVNLYDPSATSNLPIAIGRSRVPSVILFLNPRLTERDR